MIRPIGREAIVLDNLTGRTKAIIDATALDWWLHGLATQSHAQLLRAFYPNGEAPAEHQIQ
jgi:hypothetical protein